MFTTLIVFQVLLAAGLIAIVLVQRGPGATMGAAFGAGASGTVFGSRGAGNFLTRTTGWLALGFFGVSLTLAVLATGVATPEGDSALSGSVLEEQAAEQPAPDDGTESLDSMIDSLDAPEAAGQAADESAPEQGGDDDGEAVQGETENDESVPSDPPLAR